MLSSNRDGRFEFHHKDTKAQRQVKLSSSSCLCAFVVKFFMIRAQNLVKKFGDIEAVRDISFEVGEGEIFAFLGPNGAGKTTTIKMLTTLLRPTLGKVAIDGLDPVTHQNEVRQRFGIVFQDPSVDDELTAYENIDFHGVLYKVPRKARAERIRRLLDLFELWDRRNDLVKTLLGRHAPAAGDRPRPVAHAQDPVSRRAHAGPRPADPQPALDARRETERRGAGHGLSDHPLHGGSRARGAAHRHHRPRPHRRAGLARGLEAADQLRRPWSRPSWR